MLERERWSLWKRNVVDKYKSMTDEQIRQDLSKTKNPISVNKDTLILKALSIMNGKKMVLQILNDYGQRTHSRKKR